MNKLRVFEAFAGYGSQSMALERLGIDFEVVGISEIDKYAIDAYMAVHGKTKNYGDISEINWSEVPDFDFLTYSFPCVLAGTKIITDNGYKNVEDVMAGDNVLTHNGRMKEVVRTMSRLSDHFYKVKAIGCDLRITENHPMYVLRNGVEQWVKVKDLKSTDMLSYCIPSANKKTMLPNEYLWLLGRYVADGFINKYLYNSVEFAIGKDKDEEFLKNIPSDMVSKFKVFTKSCLEYRIADKELQDYCRQFGNGALNKKIPQWVIDLPKEQAKIFLMGYLSGDGHLRYRSGTPQWMFSTVSKDLFLGIQQLIMKVFGRVCSLYIRNDKRKQTFNDTYNGQVSIIESKNQVTIGNRIFVRINKIERIKRDVQVYNMEVKDDNSYTCDNVNVHNCQDISNAGQQKGLEEGSGTRSSLLWECKKAIEAKKPKYLLMENVKALTSKKFLPFLKKWQEYLESMGYCCYTRVLNSKNFGIPQNRERTFMVSILGDESFFFPEGFPLVTRLKDVLESNVDEKYYLSKRVIDTFYKRNEMNEKKGNGFRFTPTHGEGIAHSILTTAGSRPDDNYVYGNKRVQSLVESGKINGDHVQFLDAYSQAVSDDVAGTIRTTIDSSSMHFVTEPKAIGYTRDKKGKIVDRHLMDVTNTIHTPTGQGGNTDCYIAEPKIKILGNYHNSDHSASRIVDVNGISPTVMENHGTVTAIAEPCINQVGNIYDNDKNPQTGRIYDSDGISPALDTMSGGNRQPKIIEPQVINPLKGISGKSWQFEQQVYDTDGIARAIKSGEGSGNIPKIIEPNVLTPKRTEYGKAIRKEYESGKLEESRHNMTEMQPRTDGVSNTITTVQKDNLLVEPKEDIPVIPLRIPQATAKGYIEVEPGGVFDGSYPNSKTRRGRVQDGERISPTITSQGEPLNVYEGVEYKGIVYHEGDGLYTGTSENFIRKGLPGVSRTIKAGLSDAGVVQNYRIRKLTPRECFRLMGVSDSDIDKIEKAGISRTQQYRMAGNSIVVDVLCHLFRKMFIEKECESKQLRLF